MGILNLTNDGHPSVLMVLVRTLDAEGPMPRSKLEGLVAPPSLTDGVQVRQTLNRWLQIGLFVDDGERVALHHGFGSRVGSDWAGLVETATAARNLVLARENNVDLLAAEPGKAADFTHALCWVLAQQPNRLASGRYEEVVDPMQNDQIADDPLPFTNATRWTGFKEWARFLGFGWDFAAPAGLMFEPSVAVDAVLEAVFGARTELSQTDFLDALAARLPVVDGGDYRKQVESRCIAGKWRALEPHEVSPSLSLALLRLEASGRLRLEQRSDAPARTLLDLDFKPSTHQVTHFVLPEGRHA